MEPQIKAAGYGRVSTSGQVKEGESLTTQRQQITNFTKQKGWKLTNIYVDAGLSGAKMEHRTQFQQMIEDAKQGKFDVIVFTKLSRIAPNAREYLNLSHDLEQHNVLLASLKENIDPTTKTGKMIAGILALFAEWEHETIRETMLKNRVAKGRRGFPTSGKLPYGRTFDKETMKWELDPAGSR